MKSPMPAMTSASRYRLSLALTTRNETIPGEDESRHQDYLPAHSVGEDAQDGGGDYSHTCQQAQKDSVLPPVC